MQQVRCRPVEVPEAALKQQYIRCLDYLMTGQRNAYYSLMQTTLNRQAALQNITFICPEISTFLKSVYKSPTPFYIKQHVIMSREGTTQGDVAAMQMYSIATKPMVYEGEKNTKKSFYADDAAGAGTFETVHEWWTSLLAQGLKYGYFPNASKTILPVKSEHYERALQIFQGLVSK